MFVVVGLGRAGCCRGGYAGHRRVGRDGHRRAGAWPVACCRGSRSTAAAEYNGGDPIGYVVSLNLDRRHWTRASAPVVAARIARLQKGDDQHASIEAPSQERAATLLNVSRPGPARARSSMRRPRACPRGRAPRRGGHRRAGRTAAFIAWSGAPACASWVEPDGRDPCARSDPRWVRAARRGRPRRRARSAPASRPRC